MQATSSTTGGGKRRGHEIKERHFLDASDALVLLSLSLSLPSPSLTRHARVHGVGHRRRRARDPRGAGVQQQDAPVGAAGGAGGAQHVGLMERGRRKGRRGEKGAGRDPAMGHRFFFLFARPPPQTLPPLAPAWRGSTPLTSKRFCATACRSSAMATNSERRGEKWSALFFAFTLASSFFFSRRGRATPPSYRCVKRK